MTASATKPTRAQVKLSRTERAQLGEPKVGKTGVPSAYRYVPTDKWAAVRSMLLERSQHANARLNPALTAYTPGETLGLLKNPEIRGWQDAMRSFQIPPEYKTVVFVPCAKTKPWDSIHANSLYADYNLIREKVRKGEMEPVYFVTLSEPLGIVPEERWGDFPQYDDPGLFDDDAQRAGMFTRDWLHSDFGEKFIVPFDREAQQQCIQDLGAVIADFAKANEAPGRRFISFVEPLSGSPGTHSQMLSAAEAKLGHSLVSPEHRYTKTDAPRDKMPVDWMIERIRT
jgi:hypothetical protein